MKLEGKVHTSICMALLVSDRVKVIKNNTVPLIQVQVELIQSESGFSLSPKDIIYIMPEFTPKDYATLYPEFKDTISDPSF
jgi:hypothetical protein